MFKNGDLVKFDTQAIIKLYHGNHHIIEMLYGRIWEAIYEVVFISRSGFITMRNLETNELESAPPDELKIV